MKGLEAASVSECVLSDAHTSELLREVVLRESFVPRKCLYCFEIRNTDKQSVKRKGRGWCGWRETDNSRNRGTGYFLDRIFA